MNDRMPAAAIHEEYDAFGVIERAGILGPTISCHHWEDAWRLLQEFHEHGTAGEELVFAGPVALPACHQDDFGKGWIGRLYFERNTRLVVWVVSSVVAVSSRRPEGHSQHRTDSDH